jgi:AAA ATPase domain
MLQHMPSVPVTELRRWTAQLTLDPLDPGDPAEQRYVPLQEPGQGAVDDMMATIELAVDTTTQLLSGPSGSGKTTELRRLRSDLDKRGYRAVLFDVTRYVNESSPVDITEFLIALALGAHDTLGASDAAAQEGFGRRLLTLLSRLSIDLNFGGVSAKASREGLEVVAFGATVEVDLQRELKSSEPFVTELRSKLAYHVGTLYEEVAAFLRELVASDESFGLVLIVDGLEKLRGTTENDISVQESIEALFVNHASKLKFASHHMIYTVPTYLQFTAPGALF